MAMTVETVTTINLDHEQMFVFKGGPQARVRVLYGATWLTEEGRPGDAVIRSGEELPLHGGRVVLEGLAPARVQIVATSRRGALRRAADGLSRVLRGARRRLDPWQLGPAKAETRL